jgi:hypothetical protein
VLLAGTNAALLTTQSSFLYTTSCKQHAMQWAHGSCWLEGKQNSVKAVTCPGLTSTAPADWRARGFSLKVCAPRTLTRLALLIWKMSYLRMMM